MSFLIAIYRSNFATFDMEVDNFSCPYKNTALKVSLKIIWLSHDMELRSIG